MHHHHPLHLLRRAFATTSTSSFKEIAGERRASVVAILRLPKDIHRPDAFLNNDESYITKLLEDGDDLEVLFIRRAGNPKDRWSSHIAFPGGKQDKGETDLETALRETSEEIGIDLSNKEEFHFVGRLDDRDVLSPISKKRVMVLCCFVFLSFKSDLPIKLNAGEIESCYWIPIDNLLANRKIPWAPVFFSNLLPRLHPTLRDILAILPSARNLYGIHFPDTFLVSRLDADGNVIVEKKEMVPGMKTSYQYPLWGLTLWMTSDLLIKCGREPIFTRHPTPKILFYRALILFLLPVGFGAAIYRFLL